MTFDFNIHLDEQSPEAVALESIMSHNRLSPEEAIRQLLKQIAQTDTNNYDYIFTPEVIAELRKISSEIRDGGKTYTMDEVDEHFAQKRKAWQANHPS